MTPPLARTIILTDAGPVPFSTALAAYDGTPMPTPTPPPPVPAPTIAFGTIDLVKAEGNSGTTIFSAALALARDGSTAALDYSWQVLPTGTNPAAASDFGGSLPAGSGTFLTGETAKTITFLVSGDAAVEPDESFRLEVTLAGYNSITANGTITNDDAGAPIFSTPASITHDGTPAAGEQLTGVDGVVTGGAVVSRRWLSSSTVVATTNAFTPPEAGGYRFESRAEGPGGATVSAADVTVAAGVPVMPGGAIVALYAQDAAGRYNVIRNRAESARLSTSLWGHPRPGANPLVTAAVPSGPATVTKDGMGADGKPLALRMRWASGASSPGAFFMGVGQKGSAGDRVLPAGTHTIAYDLWDAGGKPQSVRLDNFPSGVAAGPVHAVTGTPQTFSYTFTLASEAVLQSRIVSPGTASTDADVHMDNIRVAPGMAIPPVVVDRHVLKIGRYQAAGAGQALALLNATGGATGRTDGQAFVPADGSGQPVAVDAVTGVFAVKLDDGKLAASGVYVLLSSSVTAADRVEVRLQGGSSGDNGPLIWGERAGLSTGPNTGSVSLHGAGLYKAGWVTAIFRGGPAGMDVFIDGFRVGTSSTPMPAGTVRDWSIGGQFYNLGFPGHLAMAAIYHRALTDAEVVQAHRAAKAQLLDIGEAYVEPTHALIVEGASNSEGDSWVPILSRSFGKRAQFHNLAYRGAGIGTRGVAGNTAWGREARMAALIAEAKALGRIPVVCMMIGTNDGDQITADPVAYATKLEVYWDWIASQGAIMVPATLTAFKQHSGVAYPTTDKYDAFNASLRQRAAAKGYTLMDFAADQRLGVWNPEHFGDPVHLIPPGRVVAAGIALTTLAPILTDRA